MSGQDAVPARELPPAPGLNALSPVAGLVAAAAAGAEAQGEVAAAVGTVAPPGHREFALDESQRATVGTLRRAANDAIHAQLIAFALLVEKDSDLRAQQCELIAEAYGTEASQLAERYHGLIHQLPPGARQPLLDLAMPALRKLPAAGSAARLEAGSSADRCRRPGIGSRISAVHDFEAAAGSGRHEGSTGALSLGQ